MQPVIVYHRAPPPQLRLHSNKQTEAKPQTRRRRADYRNHCRVADIAPIIIVATETWSPQRSSRGRRPDIHRSDAPSALHRHRLPGPPPRHTTAHLEQQRRTNQLPAAHAAQGNRSQTTNVAPHPGPPPRHKVRPPPLGRIDRADKPATQVTKIATQAKIETLPRLMEPPRASLSEAAASAHISRPGPLPRHPLTPTQEKNQPHQAQASSPKQRPQGGNDEDAIVARSGVHPELRFSPGESKPLVAEGGFLDDASKEGYDARERRRRRHRQSRV
jgi:hypothetical protein